MGIQVECPNGHVFKVKDKYAGKKGLCPHCEGEVMVQVPDALTVSETSDTLQREAIQRRQAAQHHKPAEHGAVRTCSTTRTNNRPPPAAAPAAACSVRA